MTLREIIVKYPVRNSVWNLNSKGDGFFAFAAELEYGGMKDPWNRPMQQDYHLINCPITRNH